MTPGGTEGRTALVLAAGLAVLIAVADALTSGGAILTGLLVAAPLVAATACSREWTAVVAGGTLLLALLLGVPNGFFLAGEHLAALATVAVGGTLAVVIAGLRQERERDTARLDLQYRVAREISDSESLEDLAGRVLRSIGSELGWELGALWEVRAARMRCVRTWNAAGGAATDFERETLASRFEPGTGLPGRVWEKQAPVWLPDVVKDRAFTRAEEAARAGLYAGVGFPITSGGEILGAIEFFMREPRRPDAGLVEVMATLGVQIGDFMESVRAGEALRLSEARKSAVLESALDCVITIDAEGRVLEFNPAAERTFGRREHEMVGQELAELVIPPDLRERHRSALRRLAAGGRPRILGKRVELRGLRRDGSEFPLEIAISRIADQEPPLYTAYLRDISDRKRAEAERERMLQLEQVARLGAMQARDQLESILRSVPDGVTAQAPDGRLLYANDAALVTLGASSVEDLLNTPPERVMEGFEVFGEDGREFPLERLPGRRALAGEEAPTEVVRFRIRATGEERWSVVKSSPVRAEDGSVIMAINVFEDITEHKRVELRERFLSEASAVLSTTLDADETLRRVARLAVPEVADWCGVDLAAPEGGIKRVALEHADPQQRERALELAERYPPDPSSPTGVPNVLRTGRAELHPEITDEMLEEGARDRRQLELLREFGLRSAMVVPMRIRDRTVGAITFVSGRSGRRFDEQDLSLAEEIGRRCAIALENARLYSESSRIAKTLQESLLPSELPRIPGVETAARFMPAGEGTDVGGDFYDLFQTASGWAIVVGDVCGKGPDAAAVTALARYTLRAAAMRERAPSRSLAVLNEALLRQRRDMRFCTVAYAQLEPHNGGARIGLASGGHPLPLLVRPGGEVRWLGEHGTLLGVVPDPELLDRVTDLKVGDALVFYTDGVTEARGPGGILGENGLREVVAGAAGLEADAIAGRVEAAALAAQDGSPRDDIAVVVLRITAAAG